MGVPIVGSRKAGPRVADLSLEPTVSPWEFAREGSSQSGQGLKVAELAGLVRPAARLEGTLDLAPKNPAGSPALQRDVRRAGQAKVDVKGRMRRVGCQWGGARKRAVHWTRAARVQRSGPLDGGGES